MTPWSIYLLRCSDGSLYTGIATDVARRLAEHRNPKGGRGAKYLRGRGPYELVFQHEIGDRGLALRIERCVKRFPRERKEDIGHLTSLIEDLKRQADSERCQ